MIVFDLACDHAHTFEGWFASTRDYEDQTARGMLTCPLCQSAMVTKAPMAPAVPAKGNRSAPPSPQALASGAVPAGLAEAFKTLAAAQAKALVKSEWVGDRFAAEVRSMHYGETEERQVHGRASRGDAVALVEEGIAVTPLLVPVQPPEELN